MRITYDNLKKIDEIYVHDSSFSDFRYIYGERCVELRLINHWLNQTTTLQFCNVICFEMQSCCFWGPTNAIYDMWSDNSSRFSQELLKTRETDYENYCQSYLDSECRYISIVLKIKSGDELRITCEYIDVMQSPVTDDVSL